MSTPSQTTKANTFNYVRTEMSLPWSSDPDMCTAFSTVPGGSEDVFPLVERHGLRVVESRPAGFATSNEWILLLQRT